MKIAKWDEVGRSFQKKINWIIQMYFRWTLITGLFFLQISTPVQAFELKTSLFGGYNLSLLSLEGFDHASGWNINGAAHFPYISMEAGYLDMGKFQLKNMGDSFIEVKGFTFSTFKKFEFSHGFSVDGKVGGYFWEANSFLFGNSVGGDRGSSFWIGVGANLNGPEIGLGNIGGFLQWQRFFDISGADTHTFSLGMSYTI